MLVFRIGVDKYIRNRFSFIFKDIANQEVEEVEENIALNTLGTIIHETLKSLYDPFCWEIYFRIIQNCFKQIDAETVQSGL
jgi:hypothetical protein